MNSIEHDLHDEENYPLEDERFIKFMKKKRALTKYKKNMRKGAICNPRYYISCTFVWTSTEEGGIYWGDLDNEWVKELG